MIRALFLSGLLNVQRFNIAALPLFQRQRYFRCHSSTNLDACHFTKTEFERENSERKNFYCYFIKNGNVTYNGYTNNLIRRIRQHNGELRGGAKSTSRLLGGWEYFLILSSLNWTSKRTMQVEWLCKYPTRKKPRPRSFSRPSGRVKSLKEILHRIPGNETVDIYIHSDYLFLAEDALKEAPHARLKPLVGLLGIDSNENGSICLDNAE